MSNRRRRLTHAERGHPLAAPIVPSDAERRAADEAERGPMAEGLARDRPRQRGKEIETTVTECSADIFSQHRESAVSIAFKHFPYILGPIIIGTEIVVDLEFLFGDRPTLKMASTMSRVFPRTGGGLQWNIVGHVISSSAA